MNIPGYLYKFNISPFSIYRLMLDHPPLNTIGKGKVMLVYWERTIGASIKYATMIIIQPYPKRGLMTTSGQISIEKHYRSFPQYTDHTFLSTKTGVGVWPTPMILLLTGLEIETLKALLWGIPGNTYWGLLYPCCIHIQNQDRGGREGIRAILTLL